MIETIKQNLIRSYTHTELTISDEKANILFSKLNGNLFTHINYEQKEPVWAWFVHIKFLAELAGNKKILICPQNKKAILNALKAFLTQNQNHENQWYQQIGLPHYLGRLYLILENDLSETEKNQILEFLKKGANTYPSHWSGTNLLWAVTNTIIHGVLTQDLSQIPLAIQQVEKELVIHPNGEYGIQPAYGFIPYPFQFYINETSYSFAHECAYLVYALQSTELQLAPSALGVLGFYYVFGLRYQIRNMGYDYLTIGNDVTVPDSANAENMRQAMYMFLNVEEMPCRDVMQEQFPALTYEMYSVKNDTYTPTTHRYITRRVTSHLSCSGTSPEMKLQNAPANFYAGGATCIMTNGKEYHNIFPVWDIAHIPGTTASNTPCAHWSGIENAYCGGYCHNNEGALYQDINFDGVTGVTARFFIDGMMIALGANIHSNKNTPIHTTLNQCWKIEDVSSFDNGIYQGNVLYASLDNQKILFETTNKSAQWNTFDTKDSNKESGEIFTAYFDHGSQPQGASYAYAIIPAVAKANANDRLVEVLKNLTVLRNDACVQAIQYQKQVYCVFHKNDILSINRENHFIGDAQSVHIFKN